MTDRVVTVAPRAVPGGVTGGPLIALRNWSRLG
jgi:hypothetical protein